MIVADASAALSALLNAGPARRALAGEQLHAPHLIDPEVANGLRRRVAAEEVEAAAGWVTLDTMRRLGITRYPVFSILDRVWELRDDLSAYHASYVALAELLDCNLLTADARLGRAPGIRCPVTVVPGQPSPAPSG
ncbi:MAG TPA: PIN domain-containing protein [Acidimicrobiales bacterium]|nr:PIN domain-containing protein [Acidimicrobiales bacterium]